MKNEILRLVAEEIAAAQAVGCGAAAIVAAIFATSRQEDGEGGVAFVETAAAIEAFMKSPAVQGREGAAVDLLAKCAFDVTAAASILEKIAGPRPETGLERRVREEHGPTVGQPAPGGNKETTRGWSTVIEAANAAIGVRNGRGTIIP